MLFTKKEKEMQCQLEKLQMTSVHELLAWSATNM